MPSASDTVSTSPRSRGRLLKVLGMWFGISAAIGNTIAAGIVRTPGDIAQWLPNPWLFLGVWVAGGCYALLGASSLAELGAAIPRSGGQYNFSRRALGDYAGFIVGWSDWLSTCGTNAAVAIVIGEYTAALFHLVAWTGKLVASSVLAAKTKLIEKLVEKFIAVLVLVVFTVLQWRGVKWGSRAQLITAALKSGAFLVLVAACFLLGGRLRGEAMIAASAAPALPSGWMLVVSFMLALQAVIYTVDGWDGIIYFGEEVKHPAKDVPRAIFGSVFSIMAIYLLLNAAVLYALPMSEISGNIFALGAAANKIFGRYGDPIIRSIMLVSLVSCINACQMFATRVLYTMSCDGLFFRPASKVNAGGTPVLALFLSGAVGIAFILGSFERVIAMLSFFFVANYALSYASLFLLRRREPEMTRPYRAWGYPWTTGAALVSSGVFLAVSMATDRHNAPLALGMLILSYPVFRLMRWAAARSQQTRGV